MQSAMKPLLLFVFCTLSLAAAAQWDDFHLKLDFFLNFSLATSGPFSPGMDDRLPKFSGALHLRLEWSLGTHWAVETGLGYSNMGFGEKSRLRFGNQQDGQGSFDPDQVGEAESLRLMYCSHALEVPLAIRYYLGPGSTRFYLTQGLAARLTLARSNRQFLKGPDGRTEVDLAREADWDAFAFSTLTGAGVEFYTAEHIRLFVEPRLQVSFFRGELDGEALRTTVLSPGVGLGVKW
jgi:hypothetical protein